MEPAHLISIIINLSVFILVIYLARLIYRWLHPHFSLKDQLIGKDNTALALAVTGYYSALTVILGGSLPASPDHLLAPSVDRLLVGLAGIVILNLSSLVYDKLAMRRFANLQVVIDDRNTASGLVVGANYLANGLIFAAALFTFDNALAPAMVFWLIGQMAIIGATAGYALITPFSIYSEIEKNNSAVGAAISGVLLSIGLLVAGAVKTEFTTWPDHFFLIGYYFIGGMLLVPVLRWITDRVILTGKRLSDELVNQKVPNLGAGLLEAFLYIGAALIIGWSV